MIHSTRDLMPFSGLCGHCTHEMHRHACRKAPIYINIKQKRNTVIIHNASFIITVSNTRTTF